MQVNEPRRIEIDKGEDLHERANIMGKNQFLSWVGAEDCIRENITGKYAIQMMGIDAMDTGPNQPKLNHYKYMKKKVKSIDI